ncbi:MAG: ABC transporter permease [Pseudomonadota bacterium]
MNTTSALFALARVALVEALRERILYGLLAFAIGLILLSAVLSNVTLGWPVRIVTDLSLSAISLGGAAMAILLGVRSVASEIERRVAYPVLARPIARWTYVLGRYLGVVGTVFINVLLMAVAATIMIAAYSHEGFFQYAVSDYLATLGLMLVRLAILAGLAVLFSTFTSSTVAFIASTGLGIAGHFTADLRHFLGKSEFWLTRTVGEALYWALPDLATLEALPRLIHGEPILNTQAIVAAAYGLFYLGVVLVLACWRFEGRDLP